MVAAGAAAAAFDLPFSASDAGLPTAEAITDGKFGAENEEGIGAGERLIVGGLFQIVDIIRLIVGGLAAAYLVWSGFLLVSSSGEAQETEVAKRSIVWSFLALMLMLSLDTILQDILYGGGEIGFGEILQVSDNNNFAALDGASLFISNFAAWLEALFAVLVVVMVVVSGWRMVAAMGEEEEITKQKSVLFWLAMAVVVFLFNNIAIEQVLYPWAIGASSDGNNVVASFSPNAAAGVAEITAFLFYMLTFLGVVAVLVALYAGARLIMAFGDEEGQEAAKKTLVGAGIGIVVVLSSFAVTSTLLSTDTRIREMANAGSVSGALGSTTIEAVAGETLAITINLSGLLGGEEIGDFSVITDVNDVGVSVVSFAHETDTNGDSTGIGILTLNATPTADVSSESAVLYPLYRRRSIVETGSDPEVDLEIGITVRNTANAGDVTGSLAADSSAEAVVGEPLALEVELTGLLGGEEADDFVVTSTDTGATTSVESLNTNSGILSASVTPADADSMSIDVLYLGGSVATTDISVRNIAPQGSVSGESDSYEVALSESIDQGIVYLYGLLGDEQASDFQILFDEEDIEASIEELSIDASSNASIIFDAVTSAEASRGTTDIYLLYRGEAVTQVDSTDMLEIPVTLRNIAGAGEVSGALGEDMPTEVAIGETIELQIEMGGLLGDEEARDFSLANAEGVTINITDLDVRNNLLTLEVAPDSNATAAQAIISPLYRGEAVTAGDSADALEIPIALRNIAAAGEVSGDVVENTPTEVTIGGTIAVQIAMSGLLGDEEAEDFLVYSDADDISASISGPEIIDDNGVSISVLTISITPDDGATSASAALSLLYRNQSVVETGSDPEVALEITIGVTN